MRALDHSAESDVSAANSPSGSIAVPKRSIQLPAELCESAERRYQSTFGSLEQLLEAVLNELLREDAAKLDKAETELIEKRLRDLGYL